MKKILLMVVLASGHPFALAGGNADAGAGKAKPCAACHGADFNTPIAPDIPRLAGQHSDYLAQALRDYKTGARKDPVMDGQASALSAQDIQDLAAYIHGLSGGLKVIPLHRLVQ